MEYARPRQWVFIAAWLYATAAIPDLLRADPTISRSFNGPETVWQLLDTGIGARILTHDCIPGGARDNNGCERIAVAAPAGQSALLACPISPVAALDETQVRLWVRGTRPDVQLAVRITLPRSIDPQRRVATTAIVKGSRYMRPGHWQELVVADVPKLLAAETRVMRAMPGAAIDPREAFLDAVVLVVPGDPNGVEVGTDQLDVDGVVLNRADNQIAASVQPSPTAAVQAPAPRLPAPIGAANGAIPSRTSDASDSPARLQGTTLYVEGKPFFPHAIQWNGEPLQFLADRGFNVVQLAAPPTAEQVAEATRHGLWFLCTPPKPDTVARDGLGQPSDRVLAWCLDDDAIETDPNYAQRWAELIRERDKVFDRPIIISPGSDGAAATRLADIMIARHPRISRLPAAAYDEWLGDRPLLARPGTPLWASFNTQFGEAVRQQASTLTGATAPAPAVDADQIESLIHVACTRGVRGFVFQSSSSLSETDPATRRRAAMLELINRRLQLMEPWLASGKVVGRVPSSNGAFTGIVLYVDRARLLLQVAEPTPPVVVPKTPASAAASKEIVFLVPGVPESSQVFVLSPAAMRLLPSQRMTGGMRVALPPSGDGMVVMTEDPQVIQSLRQHIARSASRSVQMERDQAVERAQTLYEIDRRLVQLGYKASVDARASASINGRFTQLDALLNAGQLEQAHDLAATLRGELKPLAADQRRAAGLATELDSNALALTSERLAECAALERTFDNLRGGDNLLPGGDFEDLSEMSQFGWQHVTHPALDIETRAALSTDQPQHGTHCLELNATVAKAKKPPVSADFLVWIASPPMRLDAGNTVEICGWVRVDKPFDTAGGGLTIIDSLGGPELSLVVDKTSGWQMFRMIRAAAETTEMRLTFALTGVGLAKVDAVMVRTLQQPVARRLPEVPGPGITRLPSTGATSGPVSAAPQTR